MTGAAAWGHYVLRDITRAVSDNVSNRECSLIHALFMAAVLCTAWQATLIPRSHRSSSPRLIKEEIFVDLIWKYRAAVQITAKRKNEKLKVKFTSFIKEIFNSYDANNVDPKEDWTSTWEIVSIKRVRHSDGFWLRSFTFRMYRLTVRYNREFYIAREIKKKNAEFLSCKY